MQREQNGVTSWTAISKELNKIFVDKNRSGKQCRQRYMNYIRFSEGSENHLKWSLEEDEKLFANFKFHGRKWVQICKSMPNRSQNCLKNRFYGAMRKICRRVQKAMKIMKIKQKKLQTQNIYLEILEFIPQNQISQSSQNEHFLNFILKLQESLIQLAILSDEQIKIDQICDLIVQIDLFMTYKKNNCLNKKLKNGLLSNQIKQVSNNFSQLKQNGQQITIQTQYTQSQCLKSSQQTFSISSIKNIELQFNLKELGLFYEPNNCYVNQDLDKEVCQIMDTKMEWRDF